MSDKTTVFRAFNNVFFEFLGEVQKVLPENNDVKDAVSGLEFFKRRIRRVSSRPGTISYMNLIRRRLDAETSPFFVTRITKTIYPIWPILTKL